MAKSDFLDEETKNRIKNDVNNKIKSAMGASRRRITVEEELENLDQSSMEYKEKKYELDLLSDPLVVARALRTNDFKGKEEAKKKTEKTGKKVNEELEKPIEDEVSSIATLLSVENEIKKSQDYLKQLEQGSDEYARTRRRLQLLDQRKTQIAREEYPEEARKELEKNEETLARIAVEARSARREREALERESAEFYREITQNLRKTDAETKSKQNAGTLERSNTRQGKGLQSDIEKIQAIANGRVTNSDKIVQDSGHNFTNGEEALDYLKRFDTTKTRMPKKERTDTKRKAEEEARKKAEAKRKAEEEARKKAEAETKRKAEEEARKKAEAEAKRKAEEEARKKAEAEAKRKAEEEARKKAEAEAKRKAEEEARKKAEAEAKRKAEEEARKKAEAETKRKAEEERRKAEVEAEEKRKAEEARRKEQEREKEKKKEKARSNAEPEISRQVNSRKRIAYNNKTAKELRNQAAGYVRSMSDQEVLEELLTVNNRVKQLNEKNTRTTEEEVQLGESEILKRALENRAKKISQETNITQADKEANTTVKRERVDTKNNSNNENERRRNQAQDLVRGMSDETVMKRLAEAERNIEQLKNSTMRTKEGENARNRVLAEWGVLREALVERAKTIDNTQIVSETNIVNEDINRDETNVPVQPRARTTIRRNSVDEIPGMRELFDKTGITDILDKQFPNGEERTEEKAVSGTKTNSIVEEAEEPSKVEEPKQVEQIQTQNPNLAMNMGNTRIIPKKTDNERLKSINFDAKKGQYYVIYGEDLDSEDIPFDISESKKWLNPKNKQTWIEDKIGLDVAKDIFDRIDKETIKKCDPFLLLTVYNFYNSREQKQKGIDFANDYLKVLQGDKNTLGFQIVYDLQNISENEKIGLWDKLKLMKLAKNHRDNLNEDDIRVYAPQKTPKTSKSVDKDTNKRDKKKLPLWKRVALGMSAALMGVTGIALTAHQGAKMLNEGKDRNNGYVDDITLENDKTETGTTITTQTRGPETRTTTATTITTKDTTTKETTSKATTNETTYTTYTTEGNTTSTTTYIDNNNNQGQEGKNDFLEEIKVKPEDQSQNNSETVTVENEVEPLTLGTIFETLPKGLTFTEGMDGGRVGKVGSRATPEDGFYVIDRAVGVEDNALDYHSGLKGTKIKDNATMVHISYIQGAKTMEEAMEIIAKNKNNKNWNSNGIGQRGWVKIETLKKIYEEQNKVKTYTSTDQER